MGAMLVSGMTVARLDFSWGDHAVWGRALTNLEKALKDHPSKHCNVIMDTMGVELKTSINKDHVDIALVNGQELNIISDDLFESTQTKVGVNYPAIGRLVSMMKEDDVFWLDKHANIKVKLLEIISE